MDITRIDITADYNAEITETEHKHGDYCRYYDVKILYEEIDGELAAATSEINKLEVKIHDIEATVKQLAATEKIIQEFEAKSKLDFNDIILLSNALDTRKSLIDDLIYYM